MRPWDALGREKAVEIVADSAGFVLKVQSLRRSKNGGAVLPRDCRHIELSINQILFELNGFKMDRLKLFFPVRQSDDECGEKGKMELSSCSSRGPVSSLASSNAARVYRVSTQFPLSLQVLRTHYRD